MLLVTVKPESFLEFLRYLFIFRTRWLTSFLSRNMKGMRELAEMKLFFLVLLTFLKRFFFDPSMKILNTKLTHSSPKMAWFNVFFALSSSSMKQKIACLFSIRYSSVKKNPDFVCNKMCDGNLVHETVKNEGMRRDHVRQWMKEIQRGPLKWRRGKVGKIKSSQKLYSSKEPKLSKSTESLEENV